MSDRIINLIARVSENERKYANEQYESKKI